ncbi:MAG: MBL fold metallo-hydrolase [Chloroflexi bacterium]|nr:MBL fold metallo-hydrolase [Chloroflexota bacterium]
MNIKLLGAHNCESRDTRLPGLLIDDVLALDAGSLASSLTFSAQLKLKAILLTHYHYDHTRDVAALAMNLFLSGATIDMYSTLPVSEAISIYLLNGRFYPDFQTRPPGNQTIRFKEIEPFKPVTVAGYNVLAVPVNHRTVPATGFQITSPDGKSVFYTGDTGPGLADCWEKISPQLLIIEVTVPNQHSQFAVTSGHLTPELLKQELLIFRGRKGYLPPVVTVHMNPFLEEKTRAEIAALAEELHSPITVGYEGMQINL